MADHDLPLRTFSGLRVYDGCIQNAYPERYSKAGTKVPTTIPWEHAAIIGVLFGKNLIDPNVYATMGSNVANSQYFIQRSISTRHEIAPPAKNAPHNRRKPPNQELSNRRALLILINAFRKFPEPTSQTHHVPSPRLAWYPRRKQLGPASLNIRAPSAPQMISVLFIVPKALAILIAFSGHLPPDFARTFYE